MTWPLPARRCFDCLEDIQAPARVFVVLRDLPPAAPSPTWVFSYNLTQEYVCEACAGWDREAVEVPLA